MTNHDMRQRAFQRLLEREAGTDADAPAIAAATRRMGDRFTQQLTPLLATPAWPRSATAPSI
ncbi:hypothetical protein [Luteitalea sp.]